MKIAVLGTGPVGQTIASKLVAVGHHVKLGSRSASNEQGAQWARQAGERASLGTFADAACFGELLFLCARGEAALDVLQSAGHANLAGKVLIDVTNPLDFSKGLPPTLSVCNDDSLAERLQRAVPEAKLVKTLNTMNCALMVAPSSLPEDTDVFLSGNDADAKAAVRRLLMEDFGWKRVTDLGDVTTARGTEMWLPLWIRLWGALGSADFNLRIVRK